MSRAAALWRALADDERDQAARALKAVLGERGTQFILAIAYDARPAPEPCGPAPYPLPDETTLRRCGDCDQVSDELEPMWDFVENKARMLDPACWQARALARHAAPSQPIYPEVPRWPA